MNNVEEILRRQAHHIATVGWAVTAVVPTHDDPGVFFAYTVGLTALQRPELVIAGLPVDISHILLNDMAARVHDHGETFTHGQRVTDLLAGHDAVIIDATDTDTLHPGTASARYGAHRVRLQQIVWPDPHGRFPWEPGHLYPPDVQPLAGRP